MNKIIRFYYILIVFIEIIIIINVSFLVQFSRGNREQQTSGNVRGVAIDDTNNLPSFLSNFNYLLGSSLILPLEDKPKWLTHRVKYSSNSGGFNSSYDYNIEKKENTFRIAAVGDSHTYGQYVNTQDNYPSQLEKLLNLKYSNCNSRNINYEVLNLGVRGFDINYTTHLYNIMGSKYNPDLILWYIKHDDFFEIMDIILEEAIRCENTNSKSKSPKTVAEQYYCYNRGIEYMHTKLTDRDIFEYNSERLDSFISSLNTKVIFFGYRNETSTISDYLNSIAKNNVYYYQIAKYEDVPRVPDNHPNKNGYTVITNKLSNYINHEILGCD